MKLRRISSVILVLMGMLYMLPASMAQTAADIKQLQNEMYKYFSTTDKEKFFEVTEQLKEVSRKAGDDRSFYKAWGNQAIFEGRNQRRSHGLEIAKQLQDYATATNDKFGIYTGGHVSASILHMMGDHPNAIIGFKRSIEYLHANFPDESAASGYLELSRMAYSENHSREAIRYAELALKEPNIIPLHMLNARSMQCLAVADSGQRNSDYTDCLSDFDNYYAERKALCETYNTKGSYGLVVEVWRSIIHKEYDQALELCKKFPSESQIAEMERCIYRQMGDFENAYKRLVIFVRIRDSINSRQNAHLLAEMTTQMNVARVENEAKELELRNQALLLEQQAAQLEQQRLLIESEELKNKNHEIELANAAIQLENDSLDHEAEEMKIREYQSKMEAQEHKEHAHHIFMFAVGIIALLIILFLSFFLYRRRLQMLKLKQAYDQLEDVTAAKERIESELRIARDIQMNMLPQRFPQRSDIDIFASMRAAKEVGGDLYDFFFQDEKLFFCVGDVSGKGVPAALFMANTISLFRTVANEGISPASIANRLNEALGLDNENGMFVTMFIGIIDLATGHLNFCNAGHNPPIIIADGQARYMEMESNAPIGLWPELEYVDEHIDSMMGQVLVIYTDGVNEAENSDMARFGDDRLLELLNGNDNHTAKQIIDKIHEDVALHVGDAEPSDDLTLLCLKMNGKASIHQETLQQ